MNRSRLEPLGVPGTDYGLDEAASRHEPSSFDRWLLKQITTKLGPGSPVHVSLWDEPDVAPRDGTVRARILDRKALWQVVVRPELHFGDLYSAGRIEVRGDLLTLLLEAYRFTDTRRGLRGLLAHGRKLAPDLSDSKRNIHHHYDLGNDFYKLWLDREALQYTCAYFADPAMTIEQAQQAKMHHVCRKLQLRAGERVVEAGGGWGGFALFMAKNYGVRVRSFNISKEQVAHSRAWAKELGLDGQVEFVEDDYRNLTGTYDAFVSIGMLEHVGKGNYKDLGALMSRALTPEGRGLVHSIGRDAPALMNAWIDKRIFPGAYPPTLREMMDLFEPNKLSVLDVENIRLHYAKTLEWWLQRYEENVDAVRAMFDEPFVRAWRLYLVGSIAAFLAGKLQLFQVLYARTAAKNVPWTRAHVYRDHP
ncbi:MAG TPA: cyclopropane-fatty-acyl-phospholipid synthase family protein [Gammaproteobacteria bacterium]|nr:cyclopropane-fatty-acyl-phospholipid synthase family protein [Gammaproteobacteria bacterium]